MELDPIGIEGLTQRTSDKEQQKPTGKFSKVLDKRITDHNRTTDHPPERVDGKEKSGQETREKSELVNLGPLSKKTRTVSDLLLKHPVYKKDMWRIIHSELNRRKAYTQMRLGTEVYLNPKSFEIVWGQKNTHVEPSPTWVKTDHLPSGNQYGDAERTDSLSEGLVKAVEPYVGKPYEELDCFQLVVEGLQNMGIRYVGRGGLGEKLIKMARRKGLPINAYFNGEGLIKASGSKVYSKSILRVRDSEAQARKVYKEMEPFLGRGFILSFSTPTRGHTGIVSQKDSLWTYINSGNMDHNVETPRDTKSVGEEYLMGEIKNWFALAAKRDESLVITLGRLQEEKLRSFVM